MNIFVFSLVAALVFSWCGKDTSIFMYIIPTTGGIFGAAIVFYLNKAKIENIFKGKVEFLKIKLKMMKSYPQEQHSEIENELSSIDEAFSMKVNQSMNDAVQEEINIQHY